MATHGMIDLETLSTRPDATILTVGAIKFDPYTNEEPHSGLYLRLNVDEQSELDRHVDDNTLEWWGKQDAKIRGESCQKRKRCIISPREKRKGRERENPTVDENGEHIMTVAEARAQAADLQNTLIAGEAAVEEKIRLD